MVTASLEAPAARARRRVAGLDATAAQTFGTLWTLLARLGVELVITHLEQPGMLALLQAHGVIGATRCRRAPRSTPCGGEP